MKKNSTLNVDYTLKQQLKQISFDENVTLQALVEGVLKNFVINFYDIKGDNEDE